MKRPHSRRSAAVAYTALFIALGGTAFAATQITGDDIQDGTVLLRDLSASAQRALLTAGDDPSDITVHAGGSAAENGASLAKAVAGATAGSTVVVRAGRYAIPMGRLPLAVPARVTVVGAGPDATRLDFDPAPNTPLSLVRLGSEARLSQLLIRRRAPNSSSAPLVTGLEVGTFAKAHDVDIEMSEDSRPATGVLMHDGSRLERASIEVSSLFAHATGVRVGADLGGSLSPAALHDLRVHAGSQGSAEALIVEGVGAEVANAGLAAEAGSAAAVVARTGPVRLRNVALAGSIDCGQRAPQILATGSAGVYAMASNLTSPDADCGRGPALIANGGAQIRIATSDLTPGAVRGDVRCVNAFDSNFEPVNGACD